MANDDEIAVTLSPREADVMRLIATGMGNTAAAAALGLSRHTVHNHLNAIYARFGVDSRIEAVLLALNEGCIEFPDHLVR